VGVEEEGIDMRLGHTEIFVKDPAAARAFYEDVLGFEVTAVQGGKFVWLEKDGREFLLRPGRKAEGAPEYQGTNVALVLYCDDLEDTMQELIDRGLSFRGNDGSEVCPTFTDPDGNWFQLVNPSEH